MKERLLRKRTENGKQGFSIGVGTVVFLAVLLYMIVSLVLFLTSRHIEYYQVTQGPLARNHTYTGIVIRSEQIVTCDTAGYVTYYAQGNARIKKAGMLFGIGASRGEGGSEGLSDKSKRAVYESVKSFASGFDSIEYHDVYSLKYDITGKLVSDTPILSSEMQAATLHSQGTYTLGNETITASPKDGIVSYSTDGFEDLTAEEVTAETFDERSYTLTDLRTVGHVAAGDRILKLIDSENWTLVIPLTSLEVVRLDGMSTIRVKFLKDGVTQTANVSVFIGNEGEYYGKLDFTEGMVRYAGDRYLDVELVTNTQTGLKIPITSIVSKEFFTIPEAFATRSEEDDSEIGFLKETRSSDGTVGTRFVSTTLYEHRDGKYYVDSTEFSSGDAVVMSGSDSERYIVRNTDTLEGVYCTNKGYAMFRKIVILDKNEEYCIVESGTKYGIAQFDYIVLNSDEVREEQIIVRK